MRKVLVALDYGGVLADDHIAIGERRLAELLGVDVEFLNSLLSEQNTLGNDVRKGTLSLASFWAKVAEACGLVQAPASSQVLCDMWAETYRLNPEFCDMTRTLRGVCGTGIITNIDPGRATYLVETVGVLNYVDYLWPSYSFGHTKAEPQFWHDVAEDVVRHGFGSTLYVDDRAHHVDCAQEAGMDGLLHQGDCSQTIMAIRRWVDEKSER